MTSFAQQNEDANTLKQEFKNFLSLEDTIATPKVELIPTGNLLVPHIEFHHKNEKNKMLARIELFGFPKVSNGGDTGAAFHSFTNCYPVEPDRKPGLLTGSFLSCNDLIPIQATLVKWARSAGKKHRICRGTKGEFIRVQSVSFAKKAYEYLKTLYFKEFHFDRVGEDIFVSRKKAGSNTQGTPTVPNQDFFQKVITGIFNVQISEFLDHENTLVIGFDSADTAKKLKTTCDAYLFESHAECRLNNETLVFPKSARYNSLEEIRETYTPDDFEKNSAKALGEDLPLVLQERLLELTRPIDTPAAQRSDTNQAMALITEIAKHFGFVEYRSGVSPDPVYQNGRTLTWIDRAPGDIAKHFEAAGYEIEVKRKSIFFHSIFPVAKGKEKPEPVSVSPQTQPTLVEEGILLELPVKIPMVYIPQILTSVSDETILEEVKKREISVVTAVSNDALIAEIKKRGPIFGQLLLRELFK